MDVAIQMACILVAISVYSLLMEIKAYIKTKRELIELQSESYKDN